MSETGVTGLTPTEAMQLIEKQPRALLVDVRSSMEHLFVGHPVGSVHVPWIDEPDWKVNPNFTTQVRKLLLGGIPIGEAGDGVPVILICRSGRRSLDAGNLLTENGISPVFHVLGGFEGELDDHHRRSSLSGWRFEGLPWEQC